MAKNINLPLARLKAKASKPKTESVAKPPAVYSYVVATTRLDEAGRLRQSGSGPNFQGGLITLTTCKRRMRASLEPEAWPGQWVVGLSGSGSFEGRQWLLFVMQVQQAYASHAELAQALPPAVREAKSSRLHIHGDLYEPKRTISDDAALEPRSYYPPRLGHRHEQPEKWHRDIHHPSWGRPAALLVGDPQLSFLWSEPTLFYQGQLTQGYKKWESLSEFVRQLGEER